MGSFTLVRRSRPAELLFSVCLSLFCVTSNAQDRVRGESSFPSRSLLAALQTTEQVVQPSRLVEGEPRFETLPEYYWEANRPLRQRLDEAIGAFHAEKPTRFHGMTIVAGSAGVGKTFIKSGLYRDEIPSEEVWKFDIREWFTEFAERGFAEYKPDIVYRDHVINQLLSLTPAGRDAFRERLESNPLRFLVVDSLDEVHPDDYLFVLSELERVALQGDRDFAHVVVFGRPLVFREYWSCCGAERAAQGLRCYQLNPPQFQTTGDLLVSNWNYHCWKYEVGRVGADGQFQPMTLSEYRRWSNQDYETTGEFADVTCKENDSARPDVRDALQQWSVQHPTVSAVLPNLAGNSMAREVVEDFVANQQGFDERRFMDEFFAKWLERDTLSGDRPSRLKPQDLELYVKLLEAVAVKYSDEDRLFPDGYFAVAPQDHVSVVHDGDTVSVSVERLLNRSGLVNLNPLDPGTPHYRFEPFWFHRLLIQMHDERRAAGETAERQRQVQSGQERAGRKTL